MEKEIEQLIDQAIKGRSFAYTPYSKFKVGAAIRLKDGTYITGCNIENISYGLTNCAERTALFKMVSMGYRKDDVDMMAIVANTAEPVSPCGACRQVMAELLASDTKICLANIQKDYRMTSVSELLPDAFEEIENAGK
ncbi:MAG TPA: cytidine deaminase [Candidatus Pelethenecus faecipullorum]|uniref:Cytidine deaminase n=1 Tax=Candidatus Pelethenecus faecipullorum TaxID=2840900 RepID=A0A9D1KIR9_9MOLU|nr:cytidine deaminase [Candidatus Pelethenecus faecipullorum]